LARYRKKPVVVDAEQFDGTNECAERLGIKWKVRRAPSGIGMEAGWFIPTLEGLMGASVGDFIITGVKGEKYACKPDIFAMTYEPAETPLDTALAAEARAERANSTGR
jgi:hypothetical protein